MTTAFAPNWWAVALRGGAAAVFGLLVLWLPPGAALGGLVTVFGLYALLDGLLALVAGGWAAAHHQRWWPALLGDGGLKPPACPDRHYMPGARGDGGEPACGLNSGG